MHLVDIVNTLIKYATWPILVAVVVRCYRSPLRKLLDELPKFMGRSYYRHGGEDIRPAQKETKSIGWDDESKECLHGSENVENGDKLHGPATASTHSGFCEHQILERVKSEYGVPIFERHSIGVSNYYFDAVMKHDGWLYGVEVKGDLLHLNLERLFENVQKAYDGFTPDVKDRFVFMICLWNGSDGAADQCAALRDIVRRQRYPTVIKYY